MRFLLVLCVCSIAQGVYAQAPEPVPAPSPSPTPSPSASPTPSPNLTPSPTPTPLGDRRLIADELAVLEAQRAELGLGGPIALLAVGGGVWIVGLSVVLVGLMGSAYCSDSYLSDCTEEDKETHDTLYLVGGILALGGGIAAIVGFVNLLDRIDERRALGRRIKDLRRERDLQYGLMLGPDRAGLTLRLAL